MASDLELIFPPSLLSAVSPSAVELFESYRTLKQEFLDKNEMLIPFPLEYQEDCFETLCARLEKDRRGDGMPPGFVPNSTFWLVNRGSEVLGVANLRHGLTDSLKVRGGHIGYGIRPSARGQGYGNAILRLTLEEARKIGITKLLITCSATNFVSAAVIRANGGVLAEEEFVNDYEATIQRYWIENE